MAPSDRFLQIHLRLLITMAIQTLTGSARVDAAPVGGAPMNMNAMMAPAQAQRAMGQALTQTSEVMGEFANRMQDAVNRTALVESEMTMEKALADYQAEMPKMDEEKWVPEWQKRSESVKAQLLGNNKLAPVVKEQLANQFAKFNSDATISIGTQANVRTVQRNKAKLLNVADFMWQAGDYERGEIAIDTAIEAGLMTPEEGVQVKKKGAERVDFYAVNRGINTDPIATLDELEAQTPTGRWKNYGNLDENQRQALVVETKRAISGVRVETMQSLSDRRNAHEIIPDSELQQLVDLKKITPTQKKWILAEQKRSGDDPAVTVAFAKALRAADGYNPNQDPTQEKFADLVGQRSGFTADQKQELEKRLNARMKPTDESNGDRTVLSYVDSLLDGNFLGNIKKDPKTGKPVDPDGYRAAYGRNIELRQQLAMYMSANPKATPVQQRDFINTKLQATNDTNAATPIANFYAGKRQTTTRAQAATDASTRAKGGPVKISTKEEFDKIPSGTFFEYNGRTGTKK